MKAVGRKKVNEKIRGKFFLAKIRLNPVTTIDLVYY